MKEVVVGEKGREVMGEGHAGPRGWAYLSALENGFMGFMQCLRRLTLDIGLRIDSRG